MKPQTDSLAAAITVAIIVAAFAIGVVTQTPWHAASFCALVWIANSIYNVQLEIFALRREMDDFELVLPAQSKRKDKP